jgi:uncharacterized membrane protein YdjX (TVP38/TMEM64 family)
LKLKRKIQKRDWVNLAGVVLFAASVAFLAGQYARAFGEVKGAGLAETAQRFREIVTAYGGAGVAVLILLHALQVVVSVIPAAIVQFAGGVIYGLPVAMLTGVIGVALGTAVSFYVSRLLGRRVVTLFVSEKNLEQMEDVLSKGASSAVLLALFIIPFPKDFIAYFIGLTRFKAWKFFLISAVGRLPGMFVAAYAGVHIFSGYGPLIAAAAVCAVSFILAFFFRGRILAFIRKRGGKGA